jgi:hypothetical protein
LYAEWNDKAAGFVGYGIQGGVRAVELSKRIEGAAGAVRVRAKMGKAVEMAAALSPAQVDSPERRPYRRPRRTGPSIRINSDRRQACRCRFGVGYRSRVTRIVVAFGRTRDE